MAAHIWADGKPGADARRWRRTAVEGTRDRSATPADTLRQLCRGVEIGGLLYLSGMLPVINRQPQFIGRLGAELTVEDGRKAAELATLSALSAIRAHLGSLDRVAGVARLGVYIATVGDFREHPKVADGASDLLAKVFGTGMLSGRVVLGVASIPLGLPVEIRTSRSSRQLNTDAHRRPSPVDVSTGLWLVSAEVS